MKLKLPLVVLVSLLSFYSFSQISITNLLEYQYGNIPSDNTDDFSSLYDRAVLNYSFDNFKAGMTFEQFYTPYENRNYTKLNQFIVQYRTKNLDIKAGNFYETIGRGLLLRSYEIPGAILEDISYRSRHYFHKDILGASAKYRINSFALKLLYGKPLNYVFPPNQDFDDRRPDEVWAASAEYGFSEQIIEVSMMSLNNKTGGTQTYNSINLSGNISPSFSYYTELAQSIENDMFFNFSDEGSYAFYVNLNYNKGDLGISAEFKDYQNFLLGAGINEPPALVREHTYRLLNRSTHVLVPLDEQGYQFEIFYQFNNGALLTVNHTLAVNQLAKKFTFQEYFAEYATTLFSKHDLKLFVDYAEDPFKEEKQRISAGIYTDWKIANSKAFSFEYEFQTFKRNSAEVSNHYVNLVLSLKSKFSANILTEWSNDPFLTEDSRIWVGGYLNYKFNYKHQVQLFAGQRRGGPACSAGVCYEILDFEGVEIRITSRL